MARTGTYPIYDRLLDGQLGALLLKWKAEGGTVEDAAFRLRSEHDIKVSVSTVHRWLALAESDAETGAVSMAWRDRRAIVLHRAAYICEECKDAPATEVDHIWPRSWGGQDDLCNLRATCMPCNRSKGGKAFTRDIDQVRASWTAAHKQQIAENALREALRWQHVAFLLINEQIPGDEALRRANDTVYSDGYRAVWDCMQAHLAGLLEAVEA
jgi:hypothetical protein